MSITLPIAEMIVRESRRSPVTGRALCFGRSTVSFDAETLALLFDRLGVSPQSQKVELDTSTRLAQENPEKRFITDHTFLQWVGVERIDVLDVSEYEGADIVHDICQPLPKSLVGQYDFVFNSSVLDNVFDPAAAFRHMCSALRPGGRIISLEMASNDCFPYLVFCPGWFQDYFAVNRFERAQVYCSQFNSIHELIYGPSMMWGALPLTNTRLSAPSITGAMAAVVAVAEFGERSTTHKSPIQGHYRSDVHQSDIDVGMEHFAKTSLPFLHGEACYQDIGKEFEIAGWKWVYCGKYGDLAKLREPREGAERSVA